MTKQEKIKEAYGHLYETHSHLIDSEGWLNNGDRNDYLTMGQTEFLGECEYIKDTFFRPISLKGINDNNGWIKIESEKDIPNETGVYWVIKNHYDYPIIERKHVDDSNYWLENFTHYHIIEKPKLPLF